MRTIIISCLVMLLLPLMAQLPMVKKGTLIRVENFDSKYVEPRNVDIWLPPDYTFHKKYPVLYMHDGQMLYDPAVTWNKQTWDVDDVAVKLIAEMKIREFIIVGIWNSGKTRHSDYFPQKPFGLLTKKQQSSVYSSVRSNESSVFYEERIASDNYLKFMVEELKPYIDKTFSTLSTMENTFIAGSSMGGLISIYAICEYPDVFGGAACLSTHWPGIFTLENNPIPEVFLKYLRRHLPDHQNHKIYFDYGTETLDAMYPQIQKNVDKVMKRKGFTQQNWITMEFSGEDHSEKAWNKRFHLPLLFLLGKQ